MASTTLQRGAREALAALLLVGASASAEVAEPTWLGPKPPKEIRRVVTIAPSLTQIVLALGAGDRLVGVSRFDEMKEVAALPRVGGFVDPSVEAVAVLQPDLVLVQPAPGNQRPVEKIAEMGMPVLALPLHSVAQTLASIRAVGRSLGLAPGAEALARDIEATRARIRKLGGDRPRPRVLVVYEWQPLVVAGPGSFAHELLIDAGAKNAASKAGTPYPVFPLEAVVAAAPEVVIDMAHDPRAGERFRGLAGISTARWVRLPSDDLMHPGPHLGRALESLFDLIHQPGDAGRGR